MEPRALEARLKAEIPECVHIEVLEFVSDAQALKYLPGSKHRGCALVVCKGVDQAKKVAARLFGQVWAQDNVPIYAAPAAKIPKEWDRELYVLEEDLERERLLEAARAPQRAHRARRRLRNKEDRGTVIKTVIDLVPPPGGPQAADAYQAINALEGDAHSKLQQWADDIDWDAMPATCDPAHKLKAPENQRQQERAQRKRLQVASYAIILKQLLHENDPSGASSRPKVVDFGSGSGNLVLPLAVLFPEVNFLSIDMKAAPIKLLNARAAEAGLTNVEGVVGTIETFTGACDVVLALHACGNATDYAMLQAERCRAAFIVCPCCVGKLKFSANIGDSIASSKDEDASTLFARARLPFVNRAAGLAYGWRPPHGSSDSEESDADECLRDARDDTGEHELAQSSGASGDDASVMPADRARGQVDSCGTCTTQAGAIDSRDHEQAPGNRDAAAAGVGSKSACMGKNEHASSGSAGDPTQRLNGARSCNGGMQEGGASTMGSEGLFGHSLLVGGLQLEHPRSAWFRACLDVPVEQFVLVARTADYSKADDSMPEMSRLAKAHIELDRMMAAKEAGYRACLTKLLQPELTTKSDVLVGAPAEAVGSKFRWPWL